MAAISFPVFKIVQQREKERRLRKTLDAVRSAIAGSKSPLSAREFIDGYRTFVVNYGSYLIEQQVGLPFGAPGIKKKILENFLKMVNNDAYGYPSTPQKLIEGNITLTMDVPTGVGGNPILTLIIPIDRRFLRHVPPHPFIGWVPNAHWEFRPATNSLGLGPADTLTYGSADWGVNASGVADIVSRGAGQALNGSRTDDW
jgi:hypothetical protein